MYILKKTNKVRHFVAVLFVTFGLIASLRAGPGGDYWRRIDPIKTEKQVADLNPDSSVMMVCGKCKTVSIAEYKSLWPNGKGPKHWVEVGSKQECGNCGGTITVVAGKNKGEIQHDCSMCGEGAAFCCAVSNGSSAKTD